MKNALQIVGGAGDYGRIEAEQQPAERRHQGAGHKGSRKTHLFSARFFAD
jgi:hypothetical protein